MVIPRAWLLPLAYLVSITVSKLLCPLLYPSVYRSTRLAFSMQVAVPLAAAVPLLALERRQDVSSASVSSGSGSGSASIQGSAVTGASSVPFFSVPVTATPTAVGPSGQPGK